MEEDEPPTKDDFPLPSTSTANVGGAEEEEDPFADMMNWGGGDDDAYDDPTKLKF